MDFRAISLLRRPYPSFPLLPSLKLWKAGQRGRFWYSMSSPSILLTRYKRGALPKAYNTYIEK